jgi:hypothetical protein
MNELLWIAQILLAGIFLAAAAGKLLAFEKVVQVVETRSKGRAVGMTRSQAALIAMAEIAGAIAVVLPIRLDPPHLVTIAAAAWLGLLMVATGIYHVWRQESAAPDVALFLLALFVIVGRWPR